MWSDTHVADVPMPSAEEDKMVIPPTLDFLTHGQHREGPKWMQWSVPIDSREPSLCLSGSSTYPALSAASIRATVTQDRWQRCFGQLSGFAESVLLN